MSVRVTVHTPCLNGAKTLYRVYESLQAQTCRDFEWVVVDDGSTDASADVVNRYAQEASFPVALHRFPTRRGKPRADNQGVRLARGEFFLTADADDRFAPTALETFLRHWDAIPADHRSRFAGVTARCQDQDGRLLGAAFATSPLDIGLTDLYHRLHHRSEKWNFVRTDILRVHPLPEVDYYVPESVVWHALGTRYLTRCINDVLRTYYVDAASSVSQTHVSRYANGFAYALLHTLNDRLGYFGADPLEFLRDFVFYGRYSRHAGRHFRQSLRDLRSPYAKAMYAALYPLSTAMVARDRWRGAAP